MERRPRGEVTVEAELVVEEHLQRHEQADEQRRQRGRNDDVARNRDDIAEDIGGPAEEHNGQRPDEDHAKPRILLQPTHCRALPLLCLSSERVPIVPDVQ